MVFHETMIHVSEDLQRIVGALKTLQNGISTNEERTVANEIMISVENNSQNCFQIGCQLLNLDKNDAIILHTGFHFIECSIRNHWPYLQEFQQNFQSISFSLLQYVRSDEFEALLSNSFCKILCEVAKRTWPQLWPNFLQDVLQLVAETGKISIFIKLLKLICEEIQSPDKSVGENRPKIMHNELKQFMPQIIEFFSKNLIISVRTTNKCSQQRKICKLILIALEDLILLSDIAVFCEGVLESDPECKSESKITLITILYNLCTLSDVDIINYSFRCLTVLISKIQKNSNSLKFLLNQFLNNDNMCTLYVCLKNLENIDPLSSYHVASFIGKYVKTLMSSPIYQEYSKVVLSQNICSPQTAENLMPTTSFVQFVIDLLKCPFAVDIFLSLYFYLSNLRLLTQSNPELNEFVTDCFLQICFIKLECIYENEEKYGEKHPFFDEISVLQISQCIEHTIKMLVAHSFSCRILLAACERYQILLTTVGDDKRLTLSQPSTGSDQFCDKEFYKLSPSQRANISFIGNVFRAYFESSQFNRATLSEPSMQPFLTCIFDVLLPSLIALDCSNNILASMVCVNLIRSSLKLLELFPDFTLLFVEKVLSLLNTASMVLKAELSLVSSKTFLGLTYVDLFIPVLKTEKMKVLEQLERQCGLAFQEICSKYSYQIAPHFDQIICLIVQRMNTEKAALDFSSEIFLISLLSSCVQHFPESRTVDVILSLSNPFSPLFHDPYYMELLMDHQKLNKVFGLPTMPENTDSVKFYTERRMIENFTQFLVAYCKVSTGFMRQVKLSCMGQELFKNSLQVLIRLHKWYCSLWHPKNVNSFGEKFFKDLHIFIDSNQLSDVCMGKGDSKSDLSLNVCKSSDSSDEPCELYPLISYLRNLGDQILGLSGMILSSDEFCSYLKSDLSIGSSIHREFWSPLLENAPTGRLHVFILHFLRPVTYKSDPELINSLSAPFFHLVCRDLITFLSNKWNSLGSIMTNDDDLTRGNLRQIDIIERNILDCFHRELISLIRSVLTSKSRNLTHSNNFQTETNSTDGSSQNLQPTPDSSNPAISNGQEKKPHNCKPSCDPSPLAIHIINNPEYRNNITRLIVMLLSSPFLLGVSKLKEFCSIFLPKVYESLDSNSQSDVELVNYSCFQFLNTVFTFTTKQLEDPNELASSISIFYDFYVLLFQRFPSVTTSLVSLLPCIDQSALKNLETKLANSFTSENIFKHSRKENMRLIKEFLLPHFKLMQQNGTDMSFNKDDSVPHREWLALINTPVPFSGVPNLKTSFKVNGHDVNINTEALRSNFASRSGSILEEDDQDDEIGQRIQDIFND